MKRTQPKIFKGRMRRYLMWDKDPKESEAVDWLTGPFKLLHENVGIRSVRMMKVFPFYV